jgi:hypothetical protein
MTNYPLGSFPRFPHQERWAQERRQRAIYNSIITRKWQKGQRQQREAEAMNQILSQWNPIVEFIKGAKCSKELAKEFIIIQRSLKNTAENWNPDRNYKGYLVKIVKRMNMFIANWNSQRPKNA